MPEMRPVTPGYETEKSIDQSCAEWPAPPQRLLLFLRPPPPTSAPLARGEFGGERNGPASPQASLVTAIFPDCAVTW